MSHDQVVVLTVLGGAVVLFIRETLRPDVVGLCVVLALLSTGILTPKEAFAGFSDPLVVLLAALFVVGGGLEAAGVTRAIADRLGPVAGHQPWRVVLVLMSVTLLFSSVLSSTGTVALLLPVALDLAARARMSPSRVLIPVAYAAGLGGTLTLVSTPPNLVASEVLADAGHEPFGFFTLTPVGLVMVGVGVALTMALLRLLPARCEPPAPSTEQRAAPPLDRRGWTALAIMSAMLVSLALDLMPAVTTVLLAAAALGLARCVPPGELYRHVPVTTLVLVATMLPLSTALQKTGVVALSVDRLSAGLAGADVRWVVAGLYAITSVVGLAISNTATAVLLAPVALGLAQATGIAPACLLATIALSASCSFATPISTPMNALVYAPGAYRFSDYLRIGLPLQLALGLVIVLLVPVVFPP